MKSLDLKTLGDTLANLRDPAGQLPEGADRLSDLAFAPNPGDLNGRCYLPPGLKPGAALVVALHGCIQNAAAFDHGAGWSRLADRHGFALLFPEQSRANNATLCFNWFQPEDMARNMGELASIRAMIAAMVDTHGLDPARVYVTGLSAGGVVAGALMAHYPEVFAAGAIIAAAPFGLAKAAPQAFSVMRAKNLPERAALQALVAEATPFAGPWPRLSVWQGSADRTVAPANAEAIIAQWSGVHALAEAPDMRETVDGARRRVWHDAAGEPIVESWEVHGMGHGAPLALSGPDAIGAAMPFMHDAGVSSTEHIAAFFGLERKKARRAAPEKAGPDKAAPEKKAAAPKAPRPPVAPEAGAVSAAKPEGTTAKPARPRGLMARLFRRIGIGS